MIRTFAAPGQALELFEKKVRDSFERQLLMKLIGAEMLLIAQGRIEIRVPFDLELTQQNKFVHGGVLASMMDSACGYAALTLAPAEADVLGVEFKISLLAPVVGDLFIARAAVKRRGRTLTVCTADAFALKGNEEKLVATMLATIINLDPRNERKSYT